MSARSRGMALGSVVAVATLTLAPVAHADVVAYIVNVDVRPGYDFANADAAVAYGQSLCDRVIAGDSYAKVVEDVRHDFKSPDPYQGEYLVAQSVNELCPAQVWQLRQSAAGYARTP